MRRTVKTGHLNDAELRALAWQVLVEHLGHAGALRFSIQTQHGYGDYSELRHRALGSLSVDELLARMRQRRPAEKSGRRQPRRRSRQ